MGGARAERERHTGTVEHTPLEAIGWGTRTCASTQQAGIIDESHMVRDVVEQLDVEGGRRLGKLP